MTDWDEIEREVVEATTKANDDALTSPRYIAKRERLREQIEAGVFDGEIEYEDDEYQSELNRSGQ